MHLLIHIFLLLNASIVSSTSSDISVPDVDVKKYSYICLQANQDRCLGISPGSGEPYFDPNDLFELQVKNRLNNEYKGDDYKKNRWDVNFETKTISLSRFSNLCIAKNPSPDIQRMFLYPCSKVKPEFSLFNLTFNQNINQEGTLQLLGTQLCATVMRCGNLGKPYCDSESTIPVTGNEDDNFKSGAYVKFRSCYWTPNGDPNWKYAQVWRQRLDCAVGCSPFLQYNDQCDPACATEECGWDSYMCVTPSPTLPTKSPSKHPTLKPSGLPTLLPTTEAPTTKGPTTDPTKRPTKAPTLRPTSAPTTRGPTLKPSDSPTNNPTLKPTRRPTNLPTTSTPTNDPTVKPTKKPTRTPTRLPTKHPSVSPTKNPTVRPTKRPSTNPTVRPTKAPTTLSPTMSPTNETMSPTLPDLNGVRTSTPTPPPTDQTMNLSMMLLVTLLPIFILLLIVCCMFCGVLRRRRSLKDPKHWQSALPENQLVFEEFRKQQEEKRKRRGCFGLSCCSCCSNSDRNSGTKVPWNSGSSAVNSQLTVKNIDQEIIQ